MTNPNTATSIPTTNAPSMKSVIRQKTKTLKKPISTNSNLMILTERLHIQAHLACTELRLRLKKRTARYQQRSSALNLLHDYWIGGTFPRNTYDRAWRKPVFVDAQGTYCAVGYLMTQTGHEKLAKSIDESNKFILVENTNSRSMDTWLYSCGLTKEEAALIQPGYGGFVIEKVGYSVQDKVLALLSIVASVAIIILVIAMLRFIGNRTMPSTVKRHKLLLSGTAMVAIIASFVFFLPLPLTTLKLLTSQSPEAITCQGWNTPRDQRPGICNEFEEKGSVPGWREVPCEDICIL